MTKGFSEASVKRVKCCIDCNCTFYGTASSKRCKECKKIERLIHSRKAYIKRKSYCMTQREKDAKLLMDFLRSLPPSDLIENMMDIASRYCVERIHRKSKRYQLGIE